MLLPVCCNYIQGDKYVQADVSVEDNEHLHDHDPRYERAEVCVCVCVCKRNRSLLDASRDRLGS